MIEIQAKLLRGPVYFVQETVQCLITLKNIPRTNENISTPNSLIGGQKNTSDNNNSVERICWANVQLHCFCTVDESLIDCRRIIEENLDSKLINHNGNYMKNNYTKRNSIALETYSSNDTSFHESLVRGERGIIIYASKPKILFCDLQLEPQQSQTFIYTETLPSNLNPSYSSNRLKYYYKLCIGAQRIGSPIYLLKIPIRLLTIDGFPSSSSTTTNPDQRTLNGTVNEKDDDDNKSLTSTNSTSLTFDDESKDCGTSLDIALHRIEYLVGHRIPHNFNITSSFGRVAKFFIFKTVYRLGEDIIGLFDFTEGLVKCIRYSVILQSEEKISEHYLVHSSSSSSSTTTSTTAKKSKINLTNHTRFHECCLNMNHSPMILPIPFTLTPSFANDLISLKWNLHFSFVIENNNQKSTNTSINLCTETEDGRQTLAPRQLQVQVMTWDFPIKIVATYPAHVAKGFQMASIGTLNI